MEKSLIIELDGGYHNEEGQKKKDDERNQILASLGYTILRIWNNELDKNPNGVFEVILELTGKQD